jgi:hypothetical protein
MLGDNLPFIAVKEVSHDWYVELLGLVDPTMRILHITMCQDVVTFGNIGEYLRLNRINGILNKSMRLLNNIDHGLECSKNAH